MSSPRDQAFDDSDDYWRRDERSIKLHGPDGFAGMRRAGQLAAETLDFITPHVQPGISTGELDKLCHDYILGHKAIPAPLGYRGYPKSICTSINHVVCHGIPGDKRLQSGDIVNIDVTVILDGWYGDSSRVTRSNITKAGDHSRPRLPHSRSNGVGCSGPMAEAWLTRRQKLASALRAPSRPPTAIP